MNELIDTQWDVNEIPRKRDLDMEIRINRYIVGCKS